MRVAMQGVSTCTAAVLPTAAGAVYARTMLRTHACSLDKSCLLRVVPNLVNPWQGMTMIHAAACDCFAHKVLQYWCLHSVVGRGSTEVLLCWVHEGRGRVGGTQLSRRYSLLCRTHCRRAHVRSATHCR